MCLSLYGVHLGRGEGGGTEKHLPPCYIPPLPVEIYQDLHHSHPARLAPFTSSNLNPQYPLSHHPSQSPPISHHLPSPIVPSLHQSLSSHLCPSLLSQVKNLRKQVLHFFKEFESLTDEVCVDRFFSLTSKFMSYDVEEFKRCSVEVRKSTGLLAEAHRLLLNSPYPHDTWRA